MIKNLIKHLVRVVLPVHLFRSDELTVAYAGYSGIKSCYFGRFPFRANGTAIQPKFIGRRLFSKVPSLVGNGCDLLFAEVGMMTSRFFSGKGGFIIPEWTAMHIDIMRPMEELRKRGVSDFANVERCIRKFDLTYEISDDPGRFPHFYETMYLPYLKNRHGDTAMIESFPGLLKGRRNLVLLIVKEGGVPISGALVECLDPYWHLFRLGIVRGDVGLVAHGAIGALYYFTVIEGRKVDRTFIDVGATRPFLTDGITQSKLRHSAEFVIDYSPLKEHLWLRHNPASEAACTFLGKNPFVYWDRNFRLVRSNSIHT